MFTLILMTLSIFFFFFFNDTATTEIYTLSLHDALPISDPFETSVTGLPDSIDNQGRVVVKRNPAPQPNHHWGDGLEKDIMTLANLRLPLNAAGTSEIYTFGGRPVPKTRGHSPRGRMRAACDQ